MEALILVAFIIILAWTYDFWNGANDCANSIATTVSTRALSFKVAVILAAVFNFGGAFITTRVAKTMGKGIVSPQFLTQQILIFALIGAIAWTAFSTRLGIPISVTHSLIGGLVGAAIVNAGIRALVGWGLLKVLIGMILAPASGALLAITLASALSWFIKLFLSNASPFGLSQLFRLGQIFSASALSLSHGMNDTQNAMGIITAALLAGGFLQGFNVPLWVILGSGTFMSLGTVWGGRAVIRTLGRKIYKIKPMDGFCAESSSAITVIIQSLAGVPLSTSQVVTSAVGGLGAVKRRAGVNWRKAVAVLYAWIFTIPGAALISGFLSLIFRLVFRQ